MSETTFPVTFCSTCDDDVLLEAQLEDTLVHVCFHCGAIVDEKTIRWMSEDEINRAGYITEGWIDPHGSRGCRGGACGVQQPET